MFGWAQLLLIVKRRIKKGREGGWRGVAAREVTIKIRGHSCFVAEVGTRRLRGETAGGEGVGEGGEEGRGGGGGCEGDGGGKGQG